MMGLTVESLERHQRFLDRIAKSGRIWGLRKPTADGDLWVHSTANGDENRKGEGTAIVPLWSDRAYAQQCAKNHWPEYSPFEIPMEEFVNVVLPNMHKAKVLVGTNWNAHLIGHEIAPKKLLTQVKAALKEAGRAV